MAYGDITAGIIDQVTVASAGNTVGTNVVKVYDNQNVVAKLGSTYANGYLQLKTYHCDSTGTFLDPKPIDTFTLGDGTTTLNPGAITKIANGVIAVRYYSSTFRELDTVGINTDGTFSGLIDSEKTLLDAGHDNDNAYGDCFSPMVYCNGNYWVYVCKGTNGSGSQGLLVRTCSVTSSGTITNDKVSTNKLDMAVNWWANLWPVRTNQVAITLQHSTEDTRVITYTVNGSGTVSRVSILVLEATANVQLSTGFGYIKGNLFCAIYFSNGGKIVSFTIDSSANLSGLGTPVMFDGYYAAASQSPFMSDLNKITFLYAGYQGVDVHVFGITIPVTDAGVFGTPGSRVSLFNVSTYGGNFRNYIRIAQNKYAISFSTNTAPMTEKILTVEIITQPALPSDPVSRISAIVDYFDAGENGQVGVYKTEIMLGGLTSDYLSPVTNKEPLPTIPTTPPKPANYTAPYYEGLFERLTLSAYAQWLSTASPEYIMAIWGHQPSWREWQNWIASGMGGM